MTAIRDFSHGIVFASILFVGPQTLRAGSATWNIDPASADWNTAANWTPATVPNGRADRATFGVSNTTKVSLSARTGVSEIVFEPGASTYTIRAPKKQQTALTISGRGVINNSGVGQTFVAPFFGTDFPGPTIVLRHNASAGVLTTFKTTRTGVIHFEENSNADHATLIGDAEAFITFSETASAGAATITLNGGTQAFERGAVAIFADSTDAANSILIANGGSNGGDGGAIVLSDDSIGGLAQAKIYGNGSLGVDHNLPGATIGSIEGDGTIDLGGSILAVGSNGRSTVFSGVIRDFNTSSEKGTLIKTGSGTLRLTNASTYTGGTTIETGQLLVNNSTGSATGSGPVRSNDGTLGGNGFIAGPVTIGDGSIHATLAPGAASAAPATLIVQSQLIFSDYANYSWKLNTKKAKADQVAATGVIIRRNVLFLVDGIGSNPLPAGTVFTVISNTAATPIAGHFVNLADGSTLTMNGNKFRVSYTGGDGNDLTLTIVP